MSPEMQQFESHFQPSDSSQPLPFDQARYQEELQDFTNFFERLASLDTRDWFASGDSPRTAPAGQARPAPIAQATQSAPRLATARPSAAAQPGTAQSEPLSPALSAADAAGETIAAEATDSTEPMYTLPEAVTPIAPSSATVEAETPAPAAVTPARPMRMQVFHSDLASHQPGAIPALPEAFPPMRGGVHQRSGFRTFLNRLQWGLMILCGGTLLFAMGLGMGALVLSIPQRHNQNTGSPAPQAADSAAIEQAPASTALNVTGTAHPAPAAKTASHKAKPAVVTPTATQTPAKPALVATAETANPESAQPVVAAKPVTPSAPAPAGTGSAAKAAVVAAAPVAAAPMVSAPAVTAPVASAPASFALQVGACGSYACVEQFRNLLLAEVDSKMINIVTAGDSQTVQRVRIEPLSRDAANQLKDKLAAKDPRFAKAYLVTLH